MIERPQTRIHIHDVRDGEGFKDQADAGGDATVADVAPKKEPHPLLRLSKAQLIDVIVARDSNAAQIAVKQGYVAQNRKLTDHIQNQARQLRDAQAEAIRLAAKLDEVSLLVSGRREMTPDEVRKSALDHIAHLTDAQLARTTIDTPAGLL